METFKLFFPRFGELTISEVALPGAHHAGLTNINVDEAFMFGIATSLFGFDAA